MDALRHAPVHNCLAALRAAATGSRAESRLPPFHNLWNSCAAQVDYLDGITVDLGEWWFNVRESNTEPLLRLNLEANTQRLLDEKLGELKKILGEPVHGH